MLLDKLTEKLDELWPQSDKEDWDKPGLMLGSPSQEISKVLLTIDVTSEVIEEAKSLGANLILSHHPLFMRGVHDLAESGVKGFLAATAIRSGIAVFAAHTNADFQPLGVTRSLATKLGLSAIRGLESTNNHVVIGEIAETTLLDFARLVAKAIPAVAQGVKVAGDPARPISRVAVLAGSGDSYLGEVSVSEADVYLTSDLRHHPAQDFTQLANVGSCPALIDIAHWAAEWVWLDTAKAQLEKQVPQVEFVVSEINTDPWTFAVMQ